MPAVVLNNLYKMTQLQSSFGVTMLAIVDGQPKILTLKDALSHFIDHRRDVVTRRSLFELKEARARQEIVEGLVIAVDNIDRVIQIIRAANDAGRGEDEPRWPSRWPGSTEFLRRAGRSEDEIAKRTEKGDYALTERQAQAILDMRLQRLTGLEREKLDEEYRALCATIDRLEAILASEGKLMSVIKDELHRDPRRSSATSAAPQIVDDEGEIAVEELIADEDMVVTVSHGGYVKRNSVTRVSLAEARRARHHRRARPRMKTSSSQLFVASTHDHILMFTDDGARLRQARLRAARRLARGARQGARQLPRAQREREGRRDAAAQAVRRGQVRRHGDAERRRSRRPRSTRSRTSAPSGIIALTIDDGDHLVEVRLTDGQHDVLLATREGRAIRFPEEKVRAMGRTARGVKGISAARKATKSCRARPSRATRRRRS